MQFPKPEKSKETLKIKIEDSLLDIKKTNNSILKYIKRNVEVDSKLSQSLSTSKTPFKKSFADSLQELNKNIKGFLIGTSEGESKGKSNILGFLKDIVGKGLQFIITHPELFLMLGIGVVADLLYNYIKTNGGKIWQAIKAKISKEFEKVIQSLKNSLTNIANKFKQLKKNVTNLLKNVPFVYDKVKPLLEESDNSSVIPVKEPSKIEAPKVPVKEASESVPKTTLDNIKKSVQNTSKSETPLVTQNLESILKKEMKDVLSTDKDFLKRPQRVKNFQVAKTGKTSNSSIGNYTLPSTTNNIGISQNNFINTSNYYENRSNGFYQDSINYHNITTQEFTMNTEETNNSFVNINMPVTNSINIIKATKQPHEFLKYA